LPVGQGRRHMVCTTICSSGSATGSGVLPQVRVQSRHGQPHPSQRRSRLRGPFPLLVLATVIVLAYWYLRADWRLAGRGRNWAGEPDAVLHGRLATVDHAAQGPVATFAGLPGPHRPNLPPHGGGRSSLHSVPLRPLLVQSLGRPTKTRRLRVLRSRPSLSSPKLIGVPAGAGQVGLGVDA
jgi:hypothetical protein